ncbi:hypothetical protein Tco_1004858 [Tanacetum coccineum]|uniref:Uncharacterized protein n=1 Tax=Tanacetum coccineum TaxID=301880 RepID=A0ABQ5FDD5_9ASTR
MILLADHVLRAVISASIRFLWNIWETYVMTNYIPDEVLHVAPRARRSPLSSFPEGKVDVYYQVGSSLLLILRFDRARNEVVTSDREVQEEGVGKLSGFLPAKQMRTGTPSFATGTGEKTLAGLRQLMPTSPLCPDHGYVFVPGPILLCTVTPPGENVGHYAYTECGDGEDGRKTAEVVRLRGSECLLVDGESSALRFKAACAEAGSLITFLTFERDRLTSEVSTLHTAFQDFKEKAEAQQEEQAQLVVLKCFKSPEYQGILGHALGRAVDFGMQEGLEAGYLDAVKALKDVDFPLVNLLKSKKDAGMDEVLDCFILDGPLADLPEAAHLQPCLEQLFIPVYHSDDKAIVGETSLSFALLNVHSRAEGAKKHAAALRQLMMEIVSNPLSSQTWVGETSTSAAPLSVEDFDEVDTDEALGSVVAIPKFTFKASSFFVGSTSIVRSVGMPISAGITASVSYVSENGVSSLLDFIIVRWDHRTCESSSIQSLFLSSSLAFIPSPKLLFALSTSRLFVVCFSDAML